MGNSLPTSRHRRFACWWRTLGKRWISKLSGDMTSRRSAKTTAGESKSMTAAWPGSVRSAMTAEPRSRRRARGVLQARPFHAEACRAVCCTWEHQSGGGRSRTPASGTMSLARSSRSGPSPGIFRFWQRTWKTGRFWRPNTDSLCAGLLRCHLRRPRRHKTCACRDSCSPRRCSTSPAAGICWVGGAMLRPGSAVTRRTRRFPCKVLPFRPGVSPCIQGRQTMWVSGGAVRSKGS